MSSPCFCANAIYEDEYLLGILLHILWFQKLKLLLRIEQMPMRPAMMPQKKTTAKFALKGAIWN